MNIGVVFKLNWDVWKYLSEITLVKEGFFKSSKLERDFRDL